MEPQLQPHPVYAVASDLKDELLAQLDALGVPYVVITEYSKPRRGKPKHVLICDGECPDGAYRYRRCKKCKVRGTGLQKSARVKSEWIACNHFCDNCLE